MHSWTPDTTPSVRGRLPRTATDAIGIALVCVLYAVAAKVGLALAYENASISAVWAPSGIALAALVLGGRRMWIGVALGAFLANFIGGGSVAIHIAVCIAAGNTLEAVVGAYLLHRFGVRRALDRVRDVAILIAAAVLATMVSATIGTASLATFGLLGIDRLPSSWLLWWLADLTGALLIAPLVLVVAEAVRRPTSLRSLVDGAAMVGGVALLAVAIFAGDTPIQYLVFPVLVLAAFRAGQVGAALASFAVAAIAVPMTALGHGPFAHFAPDWGMLLSQTFCSAAAITALFLGAATLERTRARHELEGVLRERTALLAERSRQLDEARELDKAKDEVVALVSHDLRTPLTSIVGYTGLLCAEADRLEPTHRDYLEVIRASSQRLLTLVDDLLLVAQHKVGAVAVSRMDPVDIGDLVHDATRAMTPAAARRDVTIQIDAPLEPAVVSGDQARLARMVDNLLTNAVKYAEGSGHVEVAITFTGSENVRLRVWNDGPGIPAHEQHRIFERFERARDGAAGGAKGFGLGLTIARAIVEAHGGLIGVESAPAAGVAFWVELPRASVAAPAAVA